MKNRTYTADIVAERGINRRTTVLSRGAGQCCPFLNGVRYYKTHSLKEEKVFFEMNGDQVEKKQKMRKEIKDNSGTSMMYYL